MTYEDTEITGWPITVILNGKIAVSDGVLRLRKGDGRYLKRRKSPLIN